MNNWKVILATVVIYTAGLVTGSLLIRQNRGPAPWRPPAETGPLPGMLQERFLERMKMELGLTLAQEERLRRLFAESRERIQILNGLLAPEVQEELRYLREEVRAELTPDQQRKFEELRRQRPRWQPGNPPPAGPRRFGPMPQDEPNPNFPSRPAPLPRNQRPPASVPSSPPGQAPQRFPTSPLAEPPP